MDLLCAHKKTKQLQFIQRRQYLVARGARDQFLNSAQYSNKDKEHGKSKNNSLPHPHSAPYSGGGGRHYSKCASDESLIAHGSKIL